MQDFSLSWSDGLALCVLSRYFPKRILKFHRCALIHCHRPDLLDYDKLDKVRGIDALYLYKHANLTRKTGTETLD